MSLSASSFAPYVSSVFPHSGSSLIFLNKAPPPDDPGYSSQPQQPSTSRITRPWFPTQTPVREVTSYQSGGIPTWETAIAGGSGADDETEAQRQNPWETRYSMRVDFLATWAYVLGPVSGAHSCSTCRWGTDGANARLQTAFFLLVTETHNDFVRFHGTPVHV
jgi:hypothetical protein